MTDVAYRYEHFQRKLLLHDFRFERGPGPGEPFPDFDLPTLDGGRLTRADATAGQPLLMIFASFT